MAEVKVSGRRGSQSQKKEDTGGKCLSCLKQVADKDLGVQCEICMFWFHAKCVDISTEVYSFLEKNRNIHWYCDVCNKGMAQVIEEIGRRVRIY